MPRSIALVLTLLVLAPFVPLAAAEGPVDERCDATAVVVCAGANAGGRVECALAGTIATCAWTSGHVWNAYSPLQLPGSADVTTSTRVDVCRNGACASTLTSAVEACAWLPGSRCEGGEGFEGTVGPLALAMGECLLVRVTQSAHVDARSEARGVLLGEASWGQAREAAGQVCPVDDGR